MADYRDALKQNLFEKKGSNQNLMVELVIAIAEFEKVKDLDFGKIAAQKRVKMALNAVEASGMKGEEFVSVLQTAVFYYNSRVRIGEDAYLSVADVRKVVGDVDGFFGKTSGNFALNFVNAYRKYTSLMEKARFEQLSDAERTALVDAKKDVVGNLYNLQEMNPTMGAVSTAIVGAVTESNKETFVSPFTNCRANLERALNISLQYLAPKDILNSDKQFAQLILKVVKNVQMIDIYKKKADTNAVHRKMLLQEEDLLRRNIHRLKTDYLNDSVVKEGVMNACDYFNEKMASKIEPSVDASYIIGMIYPKEEQSSVNE